MVGDGTAVGDGTIGMVQDLDGTAAGDGTTGMAQDLDGILVLEAHGTVVVSTALLFMVVIMQDFTEEDFTEIHIEDTEVVIMEEVDI